MSPASRLSPPLVTAIIVNHDQSVSTTDQLCQHRRLSPALFDQVEWIVVSNGQTSPEPIEHVRLERMNNEGYGAAINRAVRGTQGETILALNADIVPEAGFLEGVIASARRLVARRQTAHRTAMIGFRLRDADGSPQGSIGRFPTLGRFLRGLLRSRPSRKYVHADEHGPTPVDWVTGACLLIDRRCFEELNGFDESYFLYYEDVDLCLRAAKKGWRVEYDPSATCRHLFPYHSRRLTIPMVYVARRGLLLYFRKHRPAWEYRTLVWIARWESWLRSHQHGGWKEVSRMIDQLTRAPANQLMDVKDWPTDKV